MTHPFDFQVTQVLLTQEYASDKRYTVASDIEELINLAGFTTYTDCFPSSWSDRVDLMLAGPHLGWSKNVHHSQMNGLSYQLDVDSILATSDIPSAASNFTVLLQECNRDDKLATETTGRSNQALSYLLFR
ncbi:hypothetical protein T11_6012 [Trichinella zimbabwensis]|uniref:Uncharacterized protein n=1 Tax=Trichinella zimbabwensis TaxID=268475 RepID=A0A0V1HBQ7_9BILA|nr:hypothetical protein T11_6012 [Trichinella zimbabwensis]